MVGAKPRKEGITGKGAKVSVTPDRYVVLASISVHVKCQHPSSASIAVFAVTYNASSDIGHSKNEVVMRSERVWLIPHCGDQLATLSPSRSFIPINTG